MDYKIKSMVVGFRISNWVPELTDFDKLCDSIQSSVIKAYPEQIYIIDSRLMLKRSYDDNFFILAYNISYYYNSSDITKIERNSFMGEFKSIIKSLIKRELEVKDIIFQELES